MAIMCPSGRNSFEACLFQVARIVTKIHTLQERFAALFINHSYNPSANELKR